jgi:hypothetical protein
MTDLLIPGSGSSLAERAAAAVLRVEESPRFAVHGRVTRVIGQVVAASC